MSVGGGDQASPSALQKESAGTLLSASKVIAIRMKSLQPVMQITSLHIRSSGFQMLPGLSDDLTG